MSQIVYIPDHADQAEDRLPEQYKGKPKLTALVRTFGDRAQTIEDIFFDMIESADVTNGHDSLLDQIGDIVGQKRNGNSDSVYKLLLFAKIGENVSGGTGEDIIKVFKLLMQCRLAYFNPIYPAGFSVTAVDPHPIGALSDIKTAISRSRIGGVGIDFFATAPDVSFSFLEDPDPNGQGFGDEGDPDVGGTLAQIV